MLFRSAGMPPVMHISLPAFALAFAGFRLFDIWKPFPCRQLERLPGGLGIMADDLGAAAWMALILRLLILAGLPAP